MKAIGTVAHTVGHRLLVLRCDPAQLPRMYAEVIDRKLQPVGRVVDVFGSVAAPYATVVCRAECRTAPEEKLFIR
ncbi:MAG: Gar1/Naf1 family protein [Methanoregulaceae archaeon]|nr:Gar1/Naf1 family protein [Methanoregulaceae archaeon]